MIKNLVGTSYFTQGMVLLEILPIRRLGTLETPLSGGGTCVLLSLQNRFQLVGFLMEQERRLVIVLILSSGMMFGSVICALKKYSRGFTHYLQNTDSPQWWGVWVGGMVLYGGGVEIGEGCSLHGRFSYWRCFLSLSKKTLFTEICMMSVSGN